MPPNNVGTQFEQSSTVMTSTNSNKTNFLEESTQTDETPMTNLSEYEVITSQDDSSSENESVMERISRLFNTARRDRGTQTAKDPLASETEKLTNDVIYFTLGKRSASPNDDEVVRCLRNCVQIIMERHSYTLNGMMSRIHLSDQTDFKYGLTTVSNEMFERQISWSRIVTWFAFGARLAKECVRNNMGHCVIELVAILTKIAVDRFTPFVRDHGGWVTLCEAYPLHNNFEDKIWKTLVWTGMGLTAIATLLAFQRST